MKIIFHAFYISHQDSAFGTLSCETVQCSQLIYFNKSFDYCAIKVVKGRCHQTKPQMRVLRKEFAPAHVRLGKRLGSNLYAFCIKLKQDFFWQGCEIAAYILSILFPTRNIMWQWICSQQRLLHFKLCLFPLFFRRGFRCQVWRFAPLLFHRPLDTEMDKIQVKQREWHQLGRAQAKGVDVVPVTVWSPVRLSHIGPTSLTWADTCTESSSDFTVAFTILNFTN